MIELKTGITLKFPSNNLSKFYPGYYYNGTDTTSDIYAAMPNRSALFFSTNGDQKVGNELGFSKSYQGANVIIWKSSEWRGGALAIPNSGDGILLMAQISGSNALTWKNNEIASKSDLEAKTPTCQEQHMIADTQILSSDSTTALWDSEITIPFDCIMIGNWKVLCQSSDANATLYYMVNTAYVQGRVQWDGTVQADNAVNIFVMNKFTKGTKLSVSVQGNCSIRGNNTSLTRYTFTFIPV